MPRTKERERKNKKTRVLKEKSYKIIIDFSVFKNYLVFFFAISNYNLLTFIDYIGIRRYE